MSGDHHKRNLLERASPGYRAAVLLEDATPGYPTAVAGGCCGLMTTRVHGCSVSAAGLAGEDVVLIDTTHDAGVGYRQVLSRSLAEHLHRALGGILWSSRRKTNLPQQRAVSRDNRSVPAGNGVPRRLSRKGGGR